jgi:integrase
VETAISRSRRYGAKSPYKPFLHHISRTQSLRHAVIRVRAIRRLIDLFRQLSKRTGLKATPHIFRHTHATDLLRAGWDAAYVQRRLGHAHIQTTIGTYAHLSPEDMGDMFERYQKERGR